MMKRWRRILRFHRTPLSYSPLPDWSYWAGSEIASPSRRPLMDYHREFLSNPAAHGFIIDRFTASDGTPCLVCTPDPVGNLGDRGTISAATHGARIHVESRWPDPRHRSSSSTAAKAARKTTCPSPSGFVPPASAASSRTCPPTATTRDPRDLRSPRGRSCPPGSWKKPPENFAFDPQPAGLLGMSMGGLVAIARRRSPGRSMEGIGRSFPVSIPSPGSSKARLRGISEPRSARSGRKALGRSSIIGNPASLPRRHPTSPTRRFDSGIPTLIAHGTTGQGLRHRFRAANLFDRRPPRLQRNGSKSLGPDTTTRLITAYPIYADIADWMLRHVVGK